MAREYFRGCGFGRERALRGADAENVPREEIRS
jgi:hypothetical protein